jgi:hypothetical protein
MKVTETKRLRTYPMIKHITGARFIKDKERKSETSERKRTSKVTD